MLGSKSSCHFWTSSKTKNILNGLDSVLHSGFGMLDSAIDYWEGLAKDPVFEKLASALMLLYQGLEYSTHMLFGKSADNHAPVYNHGGGGPDAV